MRKNRFIFDLDHTLLFADYSAEKEFFRDVFRSDADVFVNVQKSYNFWSDKGNFQTRVTISVQGDLRDRNKSQTLKEFNEFLEYVGGLGHIRDYSININHEP